MRRREASRTHLISERCPPGPSSTTTTTTTTFPKRVCGLPTWLLTGLTRIDRRATRLVVGCCESIELFVGHAGCRRHSYTRAARFLSARIRLSLMEALPLPPFTCLSNFSRPRRRPRSETAQQERAEMEFAWTHPRLFLFKLKAFGFSLACCSPLRKRLSNTTDACWPEPPTTTSPASVDQRRERAYTHRNRAGMTRAAGRRLRLFCSGITVLALLFHAWPIPLQWR
ncbi:hypothetical protein IWX90DRAFT_80437 [Phyllosticta citrichinensis]|uniref:Uncharacterized protein n=1 Tax=Phyllosticta citrichinensis TaxID=1130410 RepID=A0ABR1XFU4_9PEZI